MSEISAQLPGREARSRSALADIEADDWGLIEYEVATKKQLAAVEGVADGILSERIIFCTHPPVVTVGRFRGSQDVISWSGQTVETSRGGRATYHGPNQLVVYPIIDLRSENRIHLRPRDVGGYLRLLAESVREVLLNYAEGIELRTGVETDEEGQPRQLTGLWHGRRKVASLGVAVKRWVTYHGVAINLDYDPEAFVGIRPCGFAEGTMISLQEISGQQINRLEVQNRLRDALNRRLATSYQL